VKAIPGDPLSPLETQIVNHYFLAAPTRAVSLGLHEYDGVLPDLSAEGTKRWTLTAKQLLADWRRLLSPTSRQLVDSIERCSGSVSRAFFSTSRSGVDSTGTRWTS